MPVITDAPRMPDQLDRLLSRIRRETRWWIGVESIATVAVAASFAVTTTLAIDWLIEPPAWARAALAFAAVAGLLWLFATRLIARLLTPLADRSLALVIERRHPELGDTLSTAVGLAATAPRDTDPELARRTTQAAADIAERVHPWRLFRRRRLVGMAILGLVATGTMAGFAAAWPDVAALWTRRIIFLHDTPWPRRVQFEVIGFRDSTRTVARGSDTELLVRATTSSGSMPDLVELRMRGREVSRTARMGTRGGTDAHGQLFAYSLEGVDEDLELEVRGGDGVLRGLRLVVVDPPSLSGVAIRYELPAYLGGDERSPAFSRVVPVPRGSRVTTTFTTSKPIANATLTARFTTPIDTDASAEVVLAELTSADQPTDTIAATIPSLDADGTLSLMLTDTDGISPREPFTVSLSAVPDEPPSVALRLADISGSVTAKARLPIVGTITDDYGLRDAAITAVRANDAWTQPIAGVRSGDSILEITTDRPEVLPLEPFALRPGDTLAVQVVATDNCGIASSPNSTRGDMWTLEVVTPETLQAALEAREILLRRRLEAVIDDLMLARRGLDEQPATEPDGFKQAARRLGESASRSVGEVGEIATAFRSIRNEFDANGLLTPELEIRLVAQVADPLAALAASGLDGLVPACRTAATGKLDQRTLAAEADASLIALKSILARLLELESFNEVIEKLRGLIRTQEQIRADTLERQRRRSREALEGL